MLYIINVEISICIRSIFRFGNNHSSFSIKLVLSSRKRIAKLISSVGQIFCLYISYTISKNLMITSDIIIVTFVLNDLICLLSCSIGIEIFAKYSSVGNRVLSCGSEIINPRCLRIRFGYLLYTNQNISMEINTIAVTINVNPHMCPGFSCSIIIRAIVISGSICSLYPYTRNYSTSLRHLIDNSSGKFMCTSLCSHCIGIEVIPILVNHYPTRFKNTKFRISIYASLLIEEEATIYSLTSVDAILAEVVVKAINLLNAGKLLTVNVVGEAAVLYSPAFLNNVCKGVAVLKGSVSCTKPCTRLAVILRIGIYEGVKTIDLLVLRLLSKGIKRICSEVTLIANATGVNNTKCAVCIPVSAILGSKLDTGKHAKRICSCGINSLSLINPVKSKCKSIGALIELSLCEAEVLVTNVKLAIIDIKIIIEVDGCGNFSKHAYTLCKLKKEVPCSCIFHIRTGKHVSKVSELTGNRNLSHIKSEDIIGCHICVKINSSISDEIYGSSIFNITKPCKLTVTTGCHAEVKAVFTLLKHVKCNASAYRFIISKANIDLNNLNTRCLIANKYVTIDSAVVFIFKSKYNICITECHRLVIVACRYGKSCVRTVNCIHMCSGEVNVLRNNNVHLGCTDDFTIKHHVYFNSTVSKTGEYAVLGNSCEALVANRPSISIGNLNLVTSRADTLCSKLHGSTNSRILVLTLDHCVIKLSRAGSGRYHKKRGGYRTSKTVRRSVDNAKCVITGLLRNEGCRSTAVKVDCLNATCLEHDLCDFLHATTTGEGLLTTVKYHKYYLTGLGDTNRCSGSTVGVIAFGSVDSNLAILNKC